MSLCMGMALSAPTDRSALTGTKAGLVTRIRNKFNRLNHGHGAHARGGNNVSKSKHKKNVPPEPPRSGTVNRQQSEQNRLQPDEPSPKVRRRFSEGPGQSSRSLQPSTMPSRATSLKDVPPRGDTNHGGDTESLPETERDSETRITAVPSIVSGLSETDDGGASGNGGASGDGGLVLRSEDEEMDWRWILNLSMHFRDQSDREKFFVTYAEQPNLRRRLTVSCDYRNAPEGTLERELADMRYQRDKSAKIYEAIKDSLPAIQFYETITNLKLQTSNGRLHVHVTEDVHEIIPYPPVIAIAHLKCPKYRESDLEFESHLSGFVYKVKVRGQVYIKKEIPGPDTVDEFLYEINALYALAGSEHVIRFGGCVVDEKRERVKGLLISFASKGALIDIIFHERGQLPWRLREKWAKQIVSGLSEVHEAGYVQGDFTLSNIVIDENDNAKIIDINRRGCPVGWEPPEVTAMIDGLQRIGMYIGVKSDIFQLGMVLWGIAHEIDEPEAVPRPLGMNRAPNDVPQYFRDIVDTCLSDRPQGRLSAKEIVALFPEQSDNQATRLDGRNPEEGDAVVDGGIRNNGYIIGEPVNGVITVTLNGNGNGNRNGSGSQPNGDGYPGANSLLLSTKGSPDFNKTVTHVNASHGSGYGPINTTEGGPDDYPQSETQKIQTQGFDLDEELQVINASPSESGVVDGQQAPWSSLIGAAFGTKTSPAILDSPVLDLGDTSPHKTTNTRELINKGEEKANFERLNRNPSDEPIPRPQMNGRAATRDSEIGNEKFTTARSSLDIRRSVAV